MNRNYCPHPLIPIFSIPWIVLWEVKPNLQTIIFCKAIKFFLLTFKINNLLQKCATCIVTSVPISVLQGRCCISGKLTTLGFYRSNVPNGTWPCWDSGHGFAGKVYPSYSKVLILTALEKILWANWNGFWKQSSCSSSNCNGHRTEMEKNSISWMYKT